MGYFAQFHIFKGHLYQNEYMFWTIKSDFPKSLGLLDQIFSEGPNYSFNSFNLSLKTTLLISHEAYSSTLMKEAQLRLCKLGSGTVFKMRLSY